MYPTKSRKEQASDLVLIKKFRKLTLAGFSKWDAAKQLKVDSKHFIDLAAKRGIRIPGIKRSKRKLRLRLAELYYPWACTSTLGEILGYSPGVLKRLSSAYRWDRVNPFKPDRWVDPWLTRPPIIHIRDLKQVYELVVELEDYYEVSRISGYSIYAVRKVCGKP